MQSEPLHDPIAPRRDETARLHEGVQVTEGGRAALYEQSRNYLHQQLSQSISTITPSSQYTNATAHVPPSSFNAGQPLSQSALKVDAQCGLYDPPTCAVQPYGYASAQNSMQQYSSVDYRSLIFPQMGPVAPSHVASGHAHIGVKTIAPDSFQQPKHLNYQLLNAFGWQQAPGSEEPVSPGQHHDGRSPKEQIRDVKAASRRLNAMVEGGLPHQPTGVSLLPSKIKANAVSAARRGRGKGGGALPRPKATPKVKELRAKANGKSETQPLTQSAMQDAGAGATYELKKKGRKSSAQARQSTSIPDVEQPLHVTREGSAEIILMDSEADADGDTDECFDEKRYKFAKDVAKKAPWASVSKPQAASSQLVQLTTDNPNAADSEHSNSTSGIHRRGNTIQTDLRRKRKRTSAVLPKKDAKTIKARQCLDVKEQTPNLQDPVPHGAKPRCIDDLLKLVAFETQSYNADPRRQLELESRNREIAHQNVARGTRIARWTTQLEKSSALGHGVGEEVAMEPMPTRSKDAKPKGQMEVKTAKQKVGYTPRLNESVVSEITDSAGADDEHDATAPDGKDVEMADVGASFQRKASLLGAGDNTAPDTASKPASRRRTNAVPREVTEAKLKDLLERPKLEKLVFVPKSMSSLLRRIGRLGFRPDRYNGAGPGPAALAKDGAMPTNHRVGGDDDDDEA